MPACKSAPNNKLPANDTTQTGLKNPPPVANDLTQKDTAAKLGGLWFLEPVLVSDTATGKIPRLEFNVRSKRFTGNTGCNDMSGSFEYTDSTLTFNPRIVTTKMNCVGYNERAFLENLLRADSYRLQNGKLILMAGQTELSHWTRKVVPKPVSNKT